MVMVMVMVMVMKMEGESEGSMAPSHVIMFMRHYVCPHTKTMTIPKMHHKRERERERERESICES